MVAIGTVVLSFAMGVEDSSVSDVRQTARSTRTSSITLPGSRAAHSTSASTSRWTGSRAMMLLVVTGVGSLIHIYSTGYMAHEGGFYRFFAYLNLFMFFMLMLVLAANYLVMFVGWEGVGCASYLLIGFYFDEKSPAMPARRRSSSTASATSASRWRCS